MISEFEQWELEDQKFKVTLRYTGRRKPAWAPNLSQKKIKETKQN